MRRPRRERPFPVSQASSAGISRRGVLRGAGLLGLSLTFGGWLARVEARTPERSLALEITASIGGSRFTGIDRMVGAQWGGHPCGS